MKSAFLCAVALAHRAMTAVEARLESSLAGRARLAAKLERLEKRSALLEKENRLLRSRLSRVPAARRPHYLREERLEILAIKGATGMSNAAVARRFLLAPPTIGSWLRRCDEDGPAGLLRMAEPVNRFPDFVGQLVRELKAACPAMGKVRISQMLARAGLHLSPSTVARMTRKAPPPKRRPPATRRSPSGCTVVARHANHVWGIDLTAMPTRLGHWVPWFPGAMASLWPFAWWLGVVVDHYSRRLLALGVFTKEPTDENVLRLFDKARRNAGRAPKYTVTDQGSQFQSVYRVWCEKHGTKPRFGAVGKHGSIALVERLIRSVKEEAFGGGLVPLAASDMAVLARGYKHWYNESRPHQGLGGRTPNEVFSGVRPAHRSPRLEPRARYPARAPCAAPRVPVKGRRGVKVLLELSHSEGALHLPVVKLRRAA